MDMSRGFQYQLVGSKHACMLAVSLHSLRMFHNEPIQLVCGDESARDVARVITKSIPNIRIVNWDAPKEGGKGQQHANKTLGVRFSRFDKTIFLDADTSVHSDLTKLWPVDDEVHLTRFATWKTTGGMLQSRLQAWAEFMPERVKLMRAVDYPAINTGVFSFSSKSTAYLDEWRRLSLSNPIFMSDELVAQLIFIDYPHVVKTDRWNFSPRYSIPDSFPIRVVHYHGFQHARPSKSIGWKTWMQLYRDCYVQDLYGIRELPHDKHLKRWLQDNPKFIQTGQLQAVAPQDNSGEQ